jgi:hypothetical protein
MNFQHRRDRRKGEAKKSQINAQGDERTIRPKHKSGDESFVREFYRKVAGTLKKFGEFRSRNAVWHRFIPPAEFKDSSRWSKVKTSCRWSGLKIHAARRS